MDLSASLQKLRLEVSPDAIGRMECLADELLRWNRRRNLTAITARADVLEKHLVDSLTVLPLLKDANNLLDLGSGAGFPALPIKLARPALSVVSVDSVAKKIAFQKHMARQFNLQGFDACHGRIETLAGDDEWQRRFDLVTARALCGLAELLDKARPFLVVGGRLVAMKGPDAMREVEMLDGAASRACWSLELHRLRLPVSGAERCLVEAFVVDENQA